MTTKTARQVPFNQWLRGRRAPRAAAGFLAALLLSLSPLAAIAQKRPTPSGQDLLAQARALYNAQDLDGAIAAATRARATAAMKDTADLVLARARLERFRRSGDPADLVAARETLNQIDAPRLVPRDKTELLVGFGEALYLDGLYGPSSELFETALSRTEPAAGQAAAAVQARVRLLDWWATALDREAQSRFAADRRALYARIVDMMQKELSSDPGSAPATYWLAAAPRAMGDLDRAWDAAVAGWLRAALAGERGAALREDLDRLALQAIIPERARLLADNDRDRERVAAEMRAEWEGIKRDWKKPLAWFPVHSSRFSGDHLTPFRAAGFGSASSGA